VDAPLSPDAETATPRTGAQPPGQASTFRRALDAQAEPPSAHGPTVVMPAVSAPALRARTVIEREPESRGHSPRHGGGSGGGIGSDGDGNGHSYKTGDESRSARLPTTVGISILLAVAAGTALVLLNLGHTGGPLAPTAMPTKPAATSSLTPQASHSPTSNPEARPAASPNHAVTSAQSHSAAPSQSATRTPGASPGASGASFATIYWTTTPEPIVVDIQTRLARLGYLELSADGSRYYVTQRTSNDVQSQSVPDGVGYYQNSTDAAIRAFEFDYLQHRQGQLPGSGCSSQTYTALVQATG
jgi:hypothetical protein